MSSFSNYLVNKLLDHVFNGVAYTPPSAVYLALYTVAPTDAGGGTEVSGAGYARLEVDFTAAASQAIENSADLTFTASGGNFGEVVAVGIFDALTGGNLLSWDEITPATINDTDDLNFPAGDIDQTLD